MSEMSPRRSGASLLERASEVYDFGAYAREQAAPAIEPVLEAKHEPAPIRYAAPTTPAAGPQPRPVSHSAPLAIDRAALFENALLVPGAPIGALAEEFRLVKRQVLLTASVVRAAHPDRARTVLVCSAQPGEGKTYCAANLALSMAAERDVEVVLVDADFAKPDVMARLGQDDGPGLLDALADPAIDVETLVVPTDIPHLSLLPAGTKTIGDTELLAADHTRVVIERLLAADPRRILIFDSPPALAASPAAVLAMHVGQIVMVVRADSTSEGDLRDAVALLDRCEHIQLLLNAVSYAPGGRRYGYYGQEATK